MTGAAVVVRGGRDAGTFDREVAVAATGQVAVFTALAVTVGLGLAGWFVGALLTVAAGVLLGLGETGARAAAAGPANRVTLGRAVLVGGVTALVADGVAEGGLTGPRTDVLVVMATVALVLDLLDGWVARRTGTESELGARFDMEVDALLIAVLCVLVAGSLGPWVLLIGLLRYAFVLAGRRHPWLRAPLPPSRARKVVAAVQGVVLVAAAAPIVPRPLAATAVAVALASLLWSFGRDTRWLARRAR